MTMSIERTVGVSDVPDVLDRILEKGIVMDAWLFTGTPENHPSSHWPDRQLKVHGCTVSSVKNSKVLYAWNYWDTIT
jgi:hypothetical protein